MEYFGWRCVYDKGYCWSFYNIDFLLNSEMFFSSIKKKKGKRNYIGKEFMNALVFVYMVSIISLTLVPNFGVLEKRTVSEVFEGIRWIPFYDIYKDIARNGIKTIGKFFIGNMVGNIFLLTPFIVYLSCYNRKIRNTGNVIIISFFMSLTIEIIQLLENIFLGTLRSVDATDLILNTISGLIGYGIFKIFYKAKILRYVNAKEVINIRKDRSRFIRE